MIIILILQYNVFILISQLSLLLILYYIFHCVPPYDYVKGDRGSGKKRLVNCVARSMGFQEYGVDCAEIVNSIPAQTEAKLKLAIAKASVC